MARPIAVLGMPSNFTNFYFYRIEDLMSKFIPSLLLDVPFKVREMDGLVVQLGRDFSAAFPENNVFIYINPSDNSI